MARKRMTKRERQLKAQLARQFHVNEFRHLLISIKPTYLERILDGRKRVEFRYGRVGFHWTTQLWFYASAPSKTLVATGNIAYLAYGPSLTLFTTFAWGHGMTEEEVTAFTSKRSDATAMVLYHGRPFAQPIPLAGLRAEIPRFVVPQSYRYLSRDEVAAFERLRAAANQAG